MPWPGKNHRPFATWIETLARDARAAPTVKQRLAAIRHLFDWLVIGQVVPVKPAASVRGPSHIVRSGKTPVLEPTEARALLDSINVATPAGLRGRALIGLMVYSFGDGITAYLKKGGTLEKAAAMANHAATRTSQL